MNIILATLFISVTSAFAEQINFDNMKSGSKLSKEFTTDTYANQGTPNWLVSEDKNAPSKPNVLLQNGKAPYSWAVSQKSNFKDGHVELKYSILDGKEDPEAGLIWRMQDPSNYY